MKCMTAPPTPRIAGIVSSPGPTRCSKICGSERAGALDGGGGVLDAQADVADADAVAEEGGMGKAHGLGVDHEVYAALAVDGDVLGDMAAGLAEPHAVKEAHKLGGRLSSGGEFDELDARDRDAVGHGRQQRRCGGFLAANLIHQVDERAVAVDGDGAGRAATELVVEDLERQPAVVAGGRDRREEALHGQVALAGHVAVVPAPLQQVHVEGRRVGKLDEEELVGGDRADGIRVELARERVEAVEDQADARVIRAADDLPGVAVIVDVAAPGQRLEPDADAAGGGALAKRAQVGGGAIDAAERDRRGVRADEDQVGAELAHQVELALGTVEGAAALGLGHSLEIAERLEEGKLQPRVADHGADLGRGGVVGQEVGLEDLDALEASGGNGGELLAEVTADRDGGNGCLHAASLNREATVQWR